MKKRLCTVILLYGLFAFQPAGAGETGDGEQQRPEKIERAAEALQESGPGNENYAAHVSRGQSIASGFAALTGDAVNPLFGVTARSVYVFFKTPSARRRSLPWYYQPRVWGPLVLIMLAMVFKGTICEAAPFVKKPLDALGDMVNKAGAAFSMPIVISMFAESFRLPAADAVQTACNWLMPAAHAAETGSTTETFYHLLGWVVSLTIGSVVYVVVWLAANTIDVLVLISPFPAVDAGLKSLRLAMIGLLAGVAAWSPQGGVVLAVVLIAFSCLIAGWSLRLSVFGFVYSCDMLLFRSRRMGEMGNHITAFSNHGLLGQVPVRTMGVVRRNEEGAIEFSYRPWLVGKRRSLTLERPAAEYRIGTGLFNPYLVLPRDGDAFEPMLRLPPRYSGHEPELSDTLGLGGVIDASILRGFRALWNYLGRLLGGNGNTSFL